MMNYIKSEFYRIFHGREIYRFIITLALLAFSFNAVLAWFRRMDDFPYGITSHSYSNLVASPLIFGLMGAIVGMILYEGNRRNGNLKNTVAFGISRTKIFISECIVTTIISLISMVIILAVYIGSAVMLLEQAGPVELNDLLTEVPAVFLIAVACLISGIVCIEVFGKSSTGIIIWTVIWFIFPKIFFYLGLRVDVLYDIAMWMPSNFFGMSGMTVNMSRCITAWETVGGMIKCLISGVVGTIVSLAAGILLLRKREL